MLRWLLLPLLFSLSLFCQNTPQLRVRVLDQSTRPQRRERFSSRRLLLPHSQFGFRRPESICRGQSALFPQWIRGQPQWPDLEKTALCCPFRGSGRPAAGATYPGLPTLRTLESGSVGPFYSQPFTRPDRSASVGIACLRNMSFIGMKQTT